VYNFMLINSVRSEPHDCGLSEHKLNLQQVVFQNWSI